MVSEQESAGSEGVSYSGIWEEEHLRKRKKTGNAHLLMDHIFKYFLLLEEFFCFCFVCFLVF